ncbi:MAG: ATP-binding cassette domain-containing protein [Candidatus Baldrarchaeia archaeon]
MSEEELTNFRRRNIGFVFQFFNLIPTLTAKENVMLALELRGLSGKEMEAEALRLLSEVELEKRADHFPSELSGGGAAKSRNSSCPREGSAVAVM